MDCSLSSLIEASKCYRCIPGPVMQASSISLLCQWANNLTPTCLVQWSPESANCSWIDASGVHGGDLNVFRATADLATITSIDMAATGITSFTGLECIPLLNTLRLSNNNLSGSIDLSVCPLLASVELGFNQLSDVIVNGLSNLGLLDAGTNLLPTTVVNSILVTLDGLGSINGEVDLNAQSPSAPPSQAGRNAAANLITDGWTVVLDEINWAPASAVFTWTDSGGPNSGNLAFFLANADFDTVTNLGSPGAGTVTALTGMQGLISLSFLDFFNELLTTFDGRRMASVTVVTCNNSPNLATLRFDGDATLTYLSCFNCALTSLNVSGCTSLNYLHCNLNSLTSLNLSGLVSLADFDCSSNASLTTLTLTGCTALVTLDCSACALTGLNVDDCTLMDSLTCSQNPFNVGTTLDLSNCTVLNNLACRMCPGLLVVDMTNIGSMTGAIVLDSNAALTTVTTPDINVVGGDLTLYSCPNLSSISLPSCTQIVGDFLFFSSGCLTVSAVNMTDTHNVNGSACPNITTLSLDSLSTIFNPLDMTVCPNLVNVTLTALTGPAGGIAFNGCTSLVSLSLPAAGLDTNGLHCAGCSALTSVSMPNLINSRDCELTGCALTQPVVDSLLALYVTLLGTISPFTIDLSGGTSATPSASGLLDKATINAFDPGNTIAITN